MDLIDFHKISMDFIKFLSYVLLMVWISCLAFLFVDVLLKDEKLPHSLTARSLGHSFYSELVFLGVLD